VLPSETLFFDSQFCDTKVSFVTTAVRVCTKTMCDCRFCQTPPQNILEPIHCPSSLIGHSNIDNKTKNILLFGDPTRSVAFADGKEYSSLLEACGKLSISLDSVFIKDFTAGIVRFDTLKYATWIRQAPSQSDKQQTIRDCTASHKADDASMMVHLFPQMGKRIRVPDESEANTKQKVQVEFDPLRTPSHMWTSEKLLSYLLKCPRSNVEGFTKMTGIIDDYVGMHKTMICCQFLHIDGNVVDLWMPQPIVYLTLHYHQIWKEFQRRKEAIDTSWDEWLP